MARKLVNLRLPEDLLARVDEAAEVAGQTRTKFVERALQEALAFPKVAPEPGNGKVATVRSGPKSKPSLRDTWAR